MWIKMEVGVTIFKYVDYRYYREAGLKHSTSALGLFISNFIYLKQKKY